MSSHFSTSTARRSSPSYCLKGRWPGVASTTDGRPTAVNVFVKWFDDVGTDLIDFTETLHAIRNATKDGYTAWSSETHPRIGIEIDDGPDVHTYDVTLHVDLWGWIVESHTWENVDVTFRQPWGTSLLQEVTIPSRHLIQARLLA